MVERVIYALIYLCGLFLVYWLIIWVLASLGIHLPPHVPEILMVIMVLVAVLILWRLFAGSSVRLWPGPPSP
jgi:hypothetical protein